MMCPDNSTVDHLHGVRAAAFRKRLQHQVPEPAGRPAAVLLVHRVPVAEFFRKITQGCARARDPEYRIKRAADGHAADAPATRQSQ